MTVTATPGSTIKTDTVITLDGSGEPLTLSKPVIDALSGRKTVEFNNMPRHSDEVRDLLIELSADPNRGKTVIISGMHVGTINDPLITRYGENALGQVCKIVRKLTPKQKFPITVIPVTDPSQYFVQSSKVPPSVTLAPAIEKSAGPEPLIAAVKKALGI